MKNLLQIYRDWRHQRYLKKMGWTQRQYDLNNDPGFNARGYYIAKDVYCGYPYTVVFDDSIYLSTIHGTWMDGADKMSEWCRENAVGKWRDDIHYVERDWTEDLVQGVHGLSNAVMIFAFDNKDDAIMFALRFA
jgi:hypothetical protein